MIVNRIGNVWLDYRRRVLPKGAPDAQHIECRRAFYAGAEACYGTIMAMLEPGQEATEADLRKMAELDIELRNFASEVKAGRA